MSTRPIEPGLLKVFRWFVAIRLTLLVLTAWSLQRNPDPTNPRFPAVGIVFMGLLVLLLVIPDLERRMGRAFLPVALAIASVGPVIESAVTVGGRLEAGTSINSAFIDYWQLFFVLFVPMLLIAWQYRYRAVVLFAIGTTFLDLALTVPLLEGSDAELQVLGGVALARGGLFLFVGIFVVKLVAAQRHARRALAQHAATLEELATSRERNRLARELHDTLAHSLSAVAVQLEAVRSLWEADPDEARRMLDRSLRGARDGLGESRRAIHALRASPLEERGLAGALVALGDAAEERSSLAVTIHVPEDLELEPAIEQVVYRIADEALTNAVRHSDAAHASVVVAASNGTLALTVMDDGAGFDAAAAPPDGHHGLQGMLERAEMVGGSLAVTSTPGSGTVIRFELEAPQ